MFALEEVLVPHQTTAHVTLDMEESPALSLHVLESTLHFPVFAQEKVIVPH